MALHDAVVWQPILAAGGLSSPPGGLKGRLQARLPATRSAHIPAAGLASNSTTSGVRRLISAIPTLAAIPEEGRDESRPGRQECLRDENGFTPISSTSGVRRLVSTLAILFLTPLAFAQDLYRLDKSADAMGATFTVSLYGTGRTAMETAADAALAEAQRLDALLSNYRPESEWSTVNRTAAGGPVKISAELFELLAACQEYSRASEGAFDITVGPLMKIWGFYKSSGHLAPQSEVDAALRKIGYRHVHLDAAAQTVWFDTPGVELDPGGIGKGYAVDRMVEILRQKGVERALVAGADSSIYGLGAPPDEPRGWQVSIRDPRNSRRSVASVFLKDMSLSTSGSYEKFFKADGRTYSHLMDPRTGYPAQGSVSVSVLAARTIDSEAWAKPFFVNGREWTRAHRRADFRVFLCEDAKDFPCAWVE
jgi:thiamine biosynthesis lipoprotein